MGTKIYKKITGIFVFLLPFILGAIGIAANYYIIPNTFSESVFLARWIFSDDAAEIIDITDVIDMISNLNSVIPRTNDMVIIKFFWYIWMLSFIASLFFVGKRLHTKPVPNATNSVFINKTPYYIIQNISNILKKVNRERHTNELDDLIYDVKCLEEKLSVESDFGYGGIDAINCENEIAGKLQFLFNIVSNIEEGDFTENVCKLSDAVEDVEFLLKRRNEIKKA